MRKKMRKKKKKKKKKKRSVQKGAGFLSPVFLSSSPLAMLASLSAHDTGANAALSLAGSARESEREVMLLPSVADPAAYTSARLNVYSGDALGEHRNAMRFAKGTTTLAFKFEGAFAWEGGNRAPVRAHAGRSADTFPLPPPSFRARAQAASSSR